MTRVDAELRFEDLIDDIINKLSPEEAKKVFRDIRNCLDELEDEE